MGEHHDPAPRQHGRYQSISFRVSTWEIVWVELCNLSWTSMDSCIFCNRWKMSSWNWYMILFTMHLFLEVAKLSLLLLFIYWSSTPCTREFSTSISIRQSKWVLPFRHFYTPLCTEFTSYQNSYFCSALLSLLCAPRGYNGKVTKASHFGPEVYSRNVSLSA